MTQALPSALGGCISVSDLTSLQALHAESYGPGTRVYVVSEEGFYALKPATEGGFPVLGINGMRWLLDNGGTGPVFSVEADMWVSPTGDNANPGTQDAPKKTMAAAYIAAYPNGVIIHATIDSLWSDGGESMGTTGAVSITNKAWIRSDGWHTVIPGWLPMQQFKIVNWGFGSSTQFGQSYAKLNIGVNDDNDIDRVSAPAFWIGSTGTQMAIEGVGWSNRIPARVGWDYRRNNDGSVAFSNIGHAARANGKTTITTGTLAGWPIVQMSRSANVTTCRFSMPGPAQGNAPGPLGSKWFHIAPGSVVGTFPAPPDFVPGDANVITGVDYFELKYADVGADVGVTPVTGGTVSGHMLMAADLIEVVSTNAQWPQTFYQVDSIIDATHFVVLDPYGYGPRSATVAADNIGTFVLQCRSFGTSFDDWTNCTIETSFGFGPPGGSDRFNFGPTIDHTGDNSFPTRVFNGYYAGTVWDDGSSFHNGVRDRNRAATWLLWSGATGACAIEFWDTRLQNGQIRWQGGRNDTGGLMARNVLQDTNFGVSLYPCVDIPSVAEGGGVGAQAVLIEHCDNADSDATHPNIDLGDCGALVINCTAIARGRNPVLIRCNLDSTGNGVTDSYESAGYLGWEPHGGYIAGKRDDIQSMAGVYQSLGFANLVPEDLSTWTDGTGGAVTVTGGQLSPDGSHSAFRLTAPGNGSSKFKSVNLGAPVVAGDWYVAAAWVRAPAGGVNTPVGSFMWMNLAAASGAALTDVIASTSMPRSGNGEWQFVQIIGQVDAAAALAGFQWITLQIYTPTTSVPVFIDGAFLVPIPASAWAKNDAYRLLRTLRHITSYALPAGAAGTRAGQKLIGHGGLGTAKRYTVGGASGQIVIGAAAAQAIEVFDETGASLGVLRPSAFTVNP